MTLNVSDKNTGQVTSTQAASGVVVVATKDGKSIESNPIEFVIIELTKPAVSSYRVRVGQVATFQKVLGHTYELKEQKTGVALTEATGGNRMQITATQAASDVIIVATLDDNTEDSDPIEFVEITKPVFSQASAPWDTVITFPKVPGYSYALKEKKTGIALSEATSDTMQVTATQSAQNVIIVATLAGLSSESNPIEFTRIQGNTLSFARARLTQAPITTFTQKATKSGGVAGDTRTIRYSLNRTGWNVNINSNSGEVEIKWNADPSSFIITAELPQNAKYERSTATYTLVVK